MSWFQALILGIIQGLTEFLPISSSGHLVLVPAVFRWEAAPLVFDTTVHLGTLLALLVVFGRDLVGLLVAWWQGLRRREPFATAESRLAWWIILGTIPGVLAGLLLEDAIEALFSQPRAAGGFLLLTAALLTLAEIVGRRRRKLAETKWLDALLIGIGQAAAIAPGLSRSGTTITVAMFRHLTREAAARFSFLLAVPIVAGAGLAQLARWILSDGTPAQALPLLIGLLAAALSGYLAIRFLLAYLRRRPLYPFAVYCVIIGVLAIVLL